MVAPDPVFLSRILPWVGVRQHVSVQNSPQRHQGTKASCSLCLGGEPFLDICEHINRRRLTVAQPASLCYNSRDWGRGEMADAQVLGTCGAIRKGSSPFVPTISLSTSSHYLAPLHGLRLPQFLLFIACVGYVLFMLPGEKEYQITVRTIIRQMAD